MVKKEQEEIRKIIGEYCKKTRQTLEEVKANIKYHPRPGDYHHRTYTKEALSDRIPSLKAYPYTDISAAIKGKRFVEKFDYDPTKNMDATHGEYRYDIEGIQAGKAAAVDKENDLSDDVDMNVLVSSPTVMKSGVTPKTNNLQQTPRVGRSTSKSSLSTAQASSRRPLKSIFVSLDGHGRNLGVSLDAAAADDLSTVSSLYSLKAESVVEQKKGMMNQQEMLKETELNDNLVLEMATSVDAFNENVSGITQKRAAKLEKQLAMKLSGVENLNGMLEVEEAKHDNGIASTEGQIDAANDQINSLQEELDSNPSLEKQKLAELKTKYEKAVDTIQRSSGKERKIIQGELDKTKSTKEKLKDVLKSKKKTKREYWRMTRKLTQLIKSALLCVEIYHKGIASASNEERDHLSGEFDKATANHIKGQSEYAEMQKEFD